MLLKKKTLLHFLSSTPNVKVGRELFWFVIQHDFCLRGGSSYRIGKRWLSPVVEIFFCPDLLEIRDFTICEISLALSKKRASPSTANDKLFFLKFPIMEMWMDEICLKFYKLKKINKMQLS